MVLTKLMQWPASYALLFLSAIVAACAPVTTQPDRASDDTAADSESAPDSWAGPAAAGTQAPLVAVTPPVAMSGPHRGPQAATSLARRAHDEQREGDFDAAAATIERALRLDPRNPQLWHQLAGVHFDQQHWRQAAELAMRSNSFAAADKNLQARNWRLIARAREMTGDPEGAMHAYNQASRLERE